MSPAEDIVRSTTRAIAGTVREVRPLRLPPVPDELAPGAPAFPEHGVPGVSAFRAPRARRLRTRVAPVAAAAAVIALAISLAVVRDIPNGRVVPPSRDVPPAAGIPTYYVALTNPENPQSLGRAIVGDMRTGKRLATVSPPAHRTFTGVTAADDDRTFVLGARQFPASLTQAPVIPRTWYLLRVAPGTAHPARLRPLPIPSTPNGSGVAGIALSPDGSKLAVMFQPDIQGRFPGRVTLRVYSVATGRLLDAWIGPMPRPDVPMALGFDGWVDANTTLSWTADGRSLAFVYGGPAMSLDTTMRILDLARPGHALLTDSRLVLDLKPGLEPDCDNLLLTANGQAIDCGAGIYPGKTDGRGIECTVTTPVRGPLIAQYSAATGKLTRVIYQYSGTCLRVSGNVLWASPAGNMLIGRVVFVRIVADRVQQGHEIFVYSRGTLTPLSFPLASGLPTPGAIAW